MKKTNTIINILWILFTSLTFQSFAQVPDTWTKKADFTGPSRGQAVGFAIGEKGYIGLGDIKGGYQNDLWEYDPSTDSWTQKADFPGTARAAANGFSVNNKGYVACGNDGIRKNDVWEFDPIANNWTKKNDFPGQPREGAFSFTIGAKAYLGAGLISISPTVVRGNDFWEYDPTNDTWIQKSDILGLPIGWPVGFSIGSKGYMGTGNDGNKQKYFYEYDPSIDKWTQKADFGGIGRFQAVGLAVGGKGYIGLGDRSGGFTNDFWEYNPTLDTWTQRASFGGQSRTLSTGFATSNKAYVGTGFGVLYAPLNDFWEYTPCSSPVISVEPSNNIVSYGEAASFSVVVTNASSYHWQLDTGTGFTNIAEGDIYSNTTTSTLNISLPTVAMSGYKYRCEINGYCAETITTNGIATLTVAPKLIVINPSADQSKVYNSADPALFSYAFTPSLIGTDVITGLMKRTAGENAGDYTFTLGTLSAGTNYSLSVAIAPVYTIKTKDLSVIAEDKIKCYNGLIFAGDYTVTYAGFVNSEDPSVLNGKLDFGGSSITAVDPAIYSIEPSGLTSINYRITFVNGTLTIKPTPSTPIITQRFDTLISGAVSGNQWYKDGIELTGSTGQKYKVTSNGVYYTIVTANGCASEHSNSIPVLDVSIRKVSSEIFEIYPNPSHGILNVKLKSTGNEVFNIVIYNNLGSIVWKQNNASFKGTNITQIDMNNPSEGLYTVVVSNNTSSYAKKVLVTK